jgi:NADH dehydrogenase (ubiquinone) 1 alpha subcomplex subunit 13
MYGFYQVGKTNRARAEQKLEERKFRYAIAPFLQAEADAEYMERERENLKKEAEIMKDVPGWKVGESTYLTNKWMPRKVSQFERSLK